MAYETRRVTRPLATLERYAGSAPAASALATRRSATELDPAEAVLLYGRGSWLCPSDLTLPKRALS